MNMKIGIKVLESTRQIANAMSGQMAIVINAAVSRAQAGIVKEIKGSVFDWGHQSDVINALVFGEGKLLKGIGLPDAYARNAAEQILHAVVDSVEIEFKKFSKNLRGGGLTLNIQPEDFGNVLSIANANIPRPYGRELAWLEWLLIEGNKVLITDYQIHYGNFGNRSRTRTAIMIEKPGGYWKMPSQFAGVSNDNFLTRALQDREDEIVKIIEEEISLYIK